jgi:maltose O-acetyltransferase
MSFLKNNVNNMPLRFVKIVAFYHPDPYLRKQYFKKLGVAMGKNTLANLGLTVTRNKNEVCVTIGDNVSIAPNVTFICDTCANNGNLINKYEYVANKLTKSANIIVEDEVWIGANVTIFPGTTISKYSVIGAGSVVLSTTEPFGIYAGVPARKIGDIRSGKSEKA